MNPQLEQPRTAECICYKSCSGHRLSLGRSIKSCSIASQSPPASASIPVPYLSHWRPTPSSRLIGYIRTWQLKLSTFQSSTCPQVYGIHSRRKNLPEANPTHQPQCSAPMQTSGEESKPPPTSSRPRARQATNKPRNEHDSFTNNKRMRPRGPGGQLRMPLLGKGNKRDWTRYVDRRSEGLRLMLGL